VRLIFSRPLASAEAYEPRGHLPCPPSTSTRRLEEGGSIERRAGTYWTDDTFIKFAYLLSVKDAYNAMLDHVMTAGGFKVKMCMAEQMEATQRSQFTAYTR
jgi:hypothetical protein